MTDNMTDFDRILLVRNKNDHFWTIEFIDSPIASPIYEAASEILSISDYVEWSYNDVLIFRLIHRKNTKNYGVPYDSLAIRLN